MITIMDKKIHCKYCRKYIWSHENVLNCAWCLNNYHYKCIQNTLFPEQSLTHWTCKECNCSVFPFNNIKEESEYNEALQNESYINDDKLNDLESLILNDADLEDDKIEEMLQDIDPDENYYKTRINLNPSQYYNYDKFIRETTKFNS